MWSFDIYCEMIIRMRFSSVAQSCPTLCDPMNCSMPGSLSITNSQSPPKLMSIESVMLSNHLSSVVPFSSLPQSFPASESFLFFFFICGGFCHTLKWNSQGFTCVPHLNPPSHLPLHPFPLGFPSAPGPSTCLMHPTWAGDLFHPR